MKSIYYLIISLSTLFLIVSCGKEKLQYGELKTPTGYEYTVHREGNGRKAQVGDYLEFTYEVYGEDSTIIQAAQDPFSYPLVQLPPKDNGQEQVNPILDLFYDAQVGDSSTMYMPYDSLRPKNPAFAKYKFLKYVVTIKSLMDEATYKAKDEERKELEMARLKELQAREGIVQQEVNSLYQQYKKKVLPLEVTASGLKYYVINPGAGAVPQKGEPVQVNYYGILSADGKMFDNSFSKGKPFSLKVGTGMVIPGWDEVLMMLSRGSKVLTVIPPALGYGANDRTKIPANSELMFYMEILE